MKSEDLKPFLNIAKAIQDDASELELWLPTDVGMPSRSQMVLPRAVTRKTRGYIEKLTEQINGTYERGWYDACAVMMRRLIETLLIQIYEHHGLASRIQDPVTGDFYQLNAILIAAIGERANWNLGRTTKSILPLMKDIGDKSAHSRTFNAVRADIDKLIPDFRAAVEDLLHIGGLK